MTFYLKQLEVGMIQNFNYLIGCSETKECGVVDAAFEVDRILSMAKKDGMKITTALFTHTHYDHIDGIGELTKRANIGKIYVHKNEAKALSEFKEKVTEIDDGSLIPIGNISLKVLHTPGHLPGCVCYLGDNFVVTGDTLFTGAIGRCDFPESNPKDMYRSLQKLKELPDDTRVYPGHDYGKTPTISIKKNIEVSPLLQAANEQDFIERMAAFEASRKQPL